MSAVSEKIPGELRDRAQWVAWRYESRDGRRTKVPHSAATGRRADSTDPATWSTHEAALAAVEGYSGLGFVFSASDPYLGADLDGCVDEHGELHAAAAKVVASLGGYTEVTPSGRGLHVIVRALLSGERHRTTKTAWGGDFEVYDRDRFFTMTGNGSGQIREAQAEVDALYAEMFPKVEEPPRAQNGHVHADDRELLARAFAASNGSKVRALYGGDTSAHGGDDSAADLALCGSLAFWTGPDPDRIDRLFRGSGLFRDKWDSRRGESTYGLQTIERALQGRVEYHQWDRSSGNGQAAAGGDSARPDQASEPILTRASAVRSRRVRWLWKGYMPLGYLTIQTGETKLGKSTFIAQVIAQATTGALPGEFEHQLMTVLILAVEDSREDLWKPRLDAAGADLDRVEFLNIPGDWNVRDGASLIEAGIAECAAGMVFVDAVMEHLPDPEKGESSNSTAFVRRALRPFASVCERQRVAGLISTHPPKGKADSFAGAYHGSGAFTQMSRSCLLFGWHPADRELPDEQRRRVMLRAAANIGRDPGALSFRLSGTTVQLDDGEVDEIGYVHDVQPCQVTARALLAADRGAGREERGESKADRAAALIADELADGQWHAAAPIRDRLHDEERANHNEVVAEAKKRLGVDQRQRPGVPHGGWEWRLLTALSRKDDSDDSDALARTTSKSRTDSDPKKGSNPINDGQSHQSHKDWTKSACSGQSQFQVEASRVRAREAPPGDSPEPSLAEQAVSKHGGDR